MTEPARLDRVVQSLTSLSRSGVRGLLDHDRVRVNGSTAHAGQVMLAAGDVVEVAHDVHTRLRERPVIKADPAFALLHEDDHVLVVNKAAHVLTVPSPRGRGKTLIDALQRHVERAGSSRIERRVQVVHRLDLGVSGVMVFAKSAVAAKRIKDQFAAHKPQRVYTAIVNGAIEAKSGTFRSHLATDAALNRYSTRRADKGELAVTHYEVVSHVRGATVVRVQLETGRRNQIRVHFAEAGHPVLGDPRYPRQAATPAARNRQPHTQQASITSAHPRWKARRLALHASSLSFSHPESHKSMRFEAPLPDEFARFIEGGAAARARNAP